VAKRIERVNKLFKEEVNKILLREVDFGAEVLVTITNVEVASNLRYADIKITVMPENKEKTVLKTLAGEIYNIQKILNKKLNMRPVPKIKFGIDQGAKKLHKIEEILSKIETN